MLGGRPPPQLDCFGHITRPVETTRCPFGAPSHHALWHIAVLKVLGSLSSLPVLPHLRPPARSAIGPQTHALRVVAKINTDAVSRVSPRPLAAGQAGGVGCWGGQGLRTRSRPRPDAASAASEAREAAPGGGLPPPARPPRQLPAGPHAPLLISAAVAWPVGHSHCMG